MVGLDHNRIRRQGRPTIGLRLVTVAGLLLFSLLALRSTDATSAGLAEAIRSQRSRLEAVPRDVDVMNDLANLLLVAGDDEEAEELYRRALEIDPERVATIYNLALLQAETGRRKLARPGFQKVLKIDARHAWSHYQLGTLAAASGKRNRAIEHYTRAFRLEPRLTMPDFNPHIIDNDLVIAALLSAHAADSIAFAVPQIYTDPERVRELLLPPPQVLPEGSPEDHRSTVPRGGGTRRSRKGPGPLVSEVDERTVPQSPEPVRAEPETEGSAAPGAPGPGVLREGVAAPAGATSAAPSDRPTPSGRASPGAAVTPPLPAEPSSVPERPPPASPPDSAPDPPEFEPDLGSTGRLELRLVPTPQDRLAALAASPS